MDIVLVGGKSYFLDAFINKLSKEGHKSYVISGSEFSKDVFPKAFEQYDFRYDNACIKDILDSLHPDAVIFFGAYDVNFTESMNQNDMIYYSSGLMNILMSLSMSMKKTKFVYLSYEKVFSRTSDELYNEDDKPEPAGNKAVAVRQGEVITLKDFGSDNLSSYVLRLDHLYGKPNDKRDVMEPFNTLCDEALQFGIMKANPNRIYSMLHVGDAVEYIYKLITTEDVRHSLYNISSGMSMSEQEIADIAAAGVRGRVEVQSQTMGRDYKVALDGSLFRDEFDTRVFDKPEKNMAQTAGYIYSHPRDFYEREEKKDRFSNRILSRIYDLFMIFVPYIETGICFIPFFMLNNRATGSEYFGYLDFYLIYVLIFSIIFGQQQAVFAGILATAGFIFRQQYDRSIFEVILDYNTYVWIAQIFSFGLVVGYLKDKLEAVREEDKKEIAYMQYQLDDIGKINSTNVDIKNVLETQIINQDDSLGQVYDITASLDKYEPEEVLFYATEVVARLIKSKDVAIYRVANGDYARLFAATSDVGRQLGNSIRYREMTDMYEELSQNRVYINKTMDERYPLMANAIYSGDMMDLLIMVWGISWDAMNLSRANMLRVTGYLIQRAVVSADKYIRALEDQRYEEGTYILEADAFTSLVRAYLNAANKNLTEASILAIDAGDKSEEVVSRELKSALRGTDYLGKLDDGNLYVLLSNTSPVNAGFVINRFNDMGYPARIQEGVEV